MSEPSVPVDPADKPNKAQNYQPNSHKAKEAAKADETPEKRIQQVTTGKVTQRKPSVGKRFIESFKGDDAQSVGSYLLFDVMIPTAKSLISDIVTQGIERALFGENSTRPRSGSSNPRASYQSYNRMSNPARQGFGGATARPNNIQSVRTPDDLDDLSFEYREDAIKVLDMMRDIIDQFGVVSVADLMEAAGKTGNFMDNKTGWYELPGAGVARTRGGYVLNLPRAQRLD